MLGLRTRELPNLAWLATRNTMTEDKIYTTTTTNPEEAQRRTAASLREAATNKLNRRRLGAAFVEFFQAREEGDVWVQNISPMQISLDLDIGNNEFRADKIPPSPHPINLTDGKFTFQQLKNSNRFRQVLAKRYQGRPILLLLTPEQVLAYYEALAKNLNAYDPDGAPNIDVALEHAENTYRQLTTVAVESENVTASSTGQNFAPPKTAIELVSMEMMNRGMEIRNGSLQSVRDTAGNAINRQGQIRVEEVVNPRIMHLCQQVAPTQGPEATMPPETFMATLQAMQSYLTLDDYQYIEAHGVFRTVKKWARVQLSRLATGDEGLPDNLSLEGHQNVARAENQGALNLVPQTQASMQQGQYQGPAGFANAPFQGAGSAAESMTGTVLGPDGSPLT